MTTINKIKFFVKDEDASSMIEYTVLLGVMVLSVITTIGLVGNWINNYWTAFQKGL